MSIVITTPTGNIGKRVLEQLLKAGAEVSVIARHPEKFSDEVRNRIKIHQGSQTDVDFVTKAFKGAKALFWLTPSDFSLGDVAAHHEELGRIAAQAIKTNKVPYVVNLSSAGAHLPNAGPVSGLGIVERSLNEVAENIVHLRPGFFMENFLGDIETIKRDGAIYSLLSGEISFPIIATQDIGDVAAELLLKLDWSGRNIRGLHGPEDLMFAKAANILGESIGKPVNFVQITPEQASEAFVGFGASPGFAKALIEMYQALSKPGAIAEARTPQTTTPTTLRKWSDSVFQQFFR